MRLSFLRYFFHESTPHGPRSNTLIVFGKFRFRIRGDILEKRMNQQYLETPATVYGITVSKIQLIGHQRCLALLSFRYS